MPGEDSDKHEYGHQWTQKEEEQLARRLKEQADKDRLARETHEHNEKSEK